VTNFTQFSLNSLSRARERYYVGWKLPTNVIYDQTLHNFLQIHSHAHNRDTKEATEFLTTYMLVIDVIDILNYQYKRRGEGKDTWDIPFLY